MRTTEIGKFKPHKRSPLGELLLMKGVRISDEYAGGTDGTVLRRHVTVLSTLDDKEKLQLSLNSEPDFAAYHHITTLHTKGGVRTSTNEWLAGAHNKNSLANIAISNGLALIHGDPSPRSIIVTDGKISIHTPQEPGLWMPEQSLSLPSTTTAAFRDDSGAISTLAA